MLLSIAIADAYGAGFEQATDQFIEKNNTLSKYLPHNSDTVKAGCYTDDTQQSLAIAELMIDGEDWTPLNVANKLFSAYRRDPRITYSRGFLHCLQKAKSGNELLRIVHGDSDKNGAAMRSTVIGCLREPEEVYQAATAQARATHNSIEGVAAAQVAALASHYLKRELGPVEKMNSFINIFVKGNWFDWKPHRVTTFGIDTVKAAIHWLRRTDDLSTLLQQTVHCGGDTDTAAAIAIGCASWSPHYVNDLPRYLVDELENKKYGRTYLAAKDTELRILYFS